MNEQVAEELLVLRKRKRLTIEDASELIGIDGGTLSRYENNKVTISIEMIEKILNAYEEKPAIFFKRVCANIHK